MPNSIIKVYGTVWCWDCRRARKFLEKHKITYEWINIDSDKASEQYVLEVNHGMRSVPTILFPDDSILVEPTEAELAGRLNLNR